MASSLSVSASETLGLSAVSLTSSLQQNVVEVCMVPCLEYNYTWTWMQIARIFGALEYVCKIQRTGIHAHMGLLHLGFSRWWCCLMASVWLGTWAASVLRSTKMWSISIPACG